MEIFIAILMVVAGLVLLVKGADWLIDGASKIAKSFGVPPIVIGLTIVAFGTSLPELLVSVLSAISGNSEIAFGNVVGSNIANVLLIFGVCALISHLPMKKNTLRVEIPLAIAAAVMLLLFSPDGTLSTWDGLILLAGFAIFFTYTIFVARRASENNSVTHEKTTKIPLSKKELVKTIFFIILGLAGLALGGNFTVNGASSIAATFGLSQALIGLTVVAIGTSLPELVTAIVGTLKKETDLVIGNIVGSNIFNTWWILGLSTVISNIRLSQSFTLDLWLNLATFVLVFIFAFIGKPKHAINRWQGAILLALYLTYMGFLIYRG